MRTFDDPDEEIAYMLGKEPETGTAAELGEWLGISANRINALAREGVIPRAGSKRFALKPAVRAYVNHLRAGQTGRLASNPDLQAEKLRLARANADKVELANAKARGELVAVGDVESAWVAVLRDVRAAMLAIPARVQQRLGHLTAHDVQQIDREVRDALTEASRAE
jgi:phage terminase Nu1 subunit (DNA packaging protein)